MLADGSIFDCRFTIFDLGADCDLSNPSVCKLQRAVRHRSVLIRENPWPPSIFVLRRRPNGSDPRPATTHRQSAHKRRVRACSAA